MMNLFVICLACAAMVGTLLYSEQRSSHEGSAELPNALVALGMALRLLVAVLTLTAVALSVGAL